MIIDNLLAKKDGTTLIDHSKAVEKIAILMTKNLNIVDKEIIQQIRLGALLHDIGKSINAYQKLFKNDLDKKMNTFHNEIGWAFLSSVLDIDKNKFLLSGIYWHHAATKEPKVFYEILNNLSNNDKKSLLLLYNELTNENKSIEDVDMGKTPEIPKFFIDHDFCSHKFLLVRNIIISADRLVSSSDTKKILNDEDFCKHLLNNNKKEKYIIDNHPTYENDIGGRFDTQKNIVKSINNKTTIVKASAGYGKTIIGLLWSLKSKKKLIWVSPRNIVVESVYSSILKELEELGIHLNVELYLASKRVTCNFDSNNIEDYNADIVVTNIDNYLGAFTNNSNANKSYLINNSDIIFDEFHEFNSKSALFSAFILTMKIRNRLINTNTLFLSATPSIIDFLWNSETNETLILPNKKTHYKAQHNKLYNVNIIEPEDVEVKKDSLIITNTINYAQTIKKEKNVDIVFHHKFMKDDKKEIQDKIYELYDYDKKGSIGRDSVVAGPIIQASMDISFKMISESIMSPETTLQRMGRLNRFGENDVVDFNIFLKKTNDGNKKFIDNIYNSDLREIWYEFLVNKKIKSINIDTFYEYYNEFNIINEEKIKEVIKNKYKDSKENLLKLIPKRHCKSTLKGEVQETNTLRNNTIGFYCIYRINNGDKYGVTEPFSENEFYGHEKDLKEDRKTEGRVIDLINHINNKNGFKYNSRYIKRLSLIYKGAWLEERPYVGFNKEYSKEYGLANLKIYEI